MIWLDTGELTWAHPVFRARKQLSENKLNLLNLWKWFGLQFVYTWESCDGLAAGEIPNGRRPTNGTV